MVAELRDGLALHGAVAGPPSSAWLLGLICIAMAYAAGDGCGGLSIWPA